MFECVEHCGISHECEKFRISVINNPSVRSVTREAWKRCRNHGLRREELKYLFISDSELEMKIKENSNFIEIVAPYIEPLSASFVEEPYLIILSDNEGWLLSIKGDIEKFGGKSAGVTLGANWSERIIGNNCIGTALALDKPVIIYGREHFLDAFGEYTCFGVPIRCNDKTIGVLGIRVLNKYGYQYRLQLAISFVNSIEASICNLKSNPFGISDKVKLSAMSELIATLVHDLKNPLSVIRGLGELGKLSQDTDMSTAYFNRIIKKSDEMNRLLVELLNIFRPQELCPARINDVIKEILDGFEPACNAKGIVLSFIENCDEYIEISQLLFKRAIENLITNAIQAISKGGLIEIKTESSNGHLIISIRDTAGGIPESIKSNIFEPFTYRRTGGTGLGLFMVYHAITNTHRGNVWFDSKCGEGTTFFIKLPIYKE